MPESMALRWTLPKSDLILMEFMKNVIGKDRILIHYKTLYRLEIEVVNMLNLRLSGKDQRQNNLFLLIIKNLLEILFLLLCLVLLRNLLM